MLHLDPLASGDEPVEHDRFVAEAKAIAKTFGATVALADAHVQIRHGESHALVGRNGAGKSTLVSILTGLHKPDRGEILFDGQPAPAHGDREAWRRRVACVYQRSTILPELTVAENLFVNRQPAVRMGLIGWRRLRRQARELLDSWAVDVDVDRAASSLSVEDRQLVEIARSLSYGARFVILDEPTAQLDKCAIDRLFERIRDLQQSGVSFLFISHHLQEIYDVCQTVTVFRDARRILSRPVDQLPKAALIEALTGEAGGLRALSAFERRTDASTRPVRLRARGLTGEHFASIDLDVYGGEIVGLAGSAGSGKISVAKTLAGLRRAGAGTIEVDGRLVDLGGGPSAAIAAGIGCVPQDRHTEGLVPLLSVAENATMTVPHRFGRAGLISGRRRDAWGARIIGELDIRASGPKQPVNALSGGNQQKVVMARALAMDPSVLILINPTAGVDVKSKESLLGLVDSARQAGKAIVIVSDELDDLKPCDRVLVMVGGKVAHDMPAGWTDAALVAAIEGVRVADD